MEDKFQQINPNLVIEHIEYFNKEYGIKNSIESTAKLGLKIFLEEYSPIPGTKDFEKSGLTADSDPLLHNNSAFPLYKPEDYEIIRSLKDLAHMKH